MKKIIINRSGLLPSNILSVGLIFIFSISGFAQTVRNGDYKADRSLKSDARVNPSTYALELSIPLGNYVGRAGTSMPVSFNYSSKVWQIYAAPGSSWQSTSGVKTDTEPLYAKRTAAGWTSSLSVQILRFGKSSINHLLNLRKIRI